MEPNELTIFKESFIQSFCESPEIRALLEDGEPTEESLKYRRIFPYLHDAAAGKETGAYLCIDTELHRLETGNYKHLDVIVWSYANQQQMQAEGGSRCDLLAQEAYGLINDHTFRARALKLDSMIPFRLAEGYRGKRMIFSATVMD